MVQLGRAHHGAARRDGGLVGFEDLCGRRHRCPALWAAHGQKVQQRVDAGGGDLRVAIDIVAGREPGPGVPPLGRTTPDEMHQRVHAGLLNVRIALQIPGGVEEWVGVAAVRHAPGEVVLQGVTRPDLGIGGPVPLRVEKTAGPQPVGG